MATPPIKRTEPRIDPDLEPEIGAASPSGERQDLMRAPAPRRSPVVGLLVLMLVAAGAVFFYLWRQNTSQPAVVAAPPLTQAPVAADAAPEIRHPIDEAHGAMPPNAETKPLPALMVSDATMQNTLSDLFGGASLGKIFYEDAIIHRFVATIDNLPRKSVPSRNLPVKPVAGAMVTSAKDGSVSIGADNASRYTPYVQLGEAIDAKNLVSTYVHFYPLMQQDYRDLGYPKGYFNDRLIEAIDDLLATPESGDPVRLVQPKVLYQYADPELEARSAGQKIMIRMGSENSAKVRAKLREIRSELTGPRGSNPVAPKAAQ
jgi:Protein of unknown function (DUF3014)